MNQLKETILAMDIGTGTKDIMLFEPNKNFENMIKFVVPTPALNYSRTISSQNRDISIGGYTIGGGKVVSAVKNHISRGFNVFTETLPAYTFRNNLQDVSRIGVQLQNDISNPDLYFDEIELPLYFSILEKIGFDQNQISVIGVSAQDHGIHSHGASSRKKRFEYFLEKLSPEPDIRNLIFMDTTVPKHFQRLYSAQSCIQKSHPEMKIILMDTCVSALLGARLDPQIINLEGPILFINFGNGHTMACIMEGEKILSFFEHHTSMLKENTARVGDYLKRLSEGQLQFEEIYSDGGHGCHTFSPIQYSQLSATVVTGPNRYLAKNAEIGDYIEAAPAGDMMMAGPLGLVRGYSLLEGAKIK